MTALLRFLSKNHERTITVFGVMLVALGMATPTGVVTLVVSTYSVQPDLVAILIILGMCLVELSLGNIWLQLLGIAPYTIFTVLAFSLWWRGVTGLLQSQLLYVVLWLILVQPLVRDLVSRYSKSRVNEKQVT